ncbi:MAG: hypothetical protein GX591_06805 [Planctomycetes bacterium]|nr:hypothetical protein [Planctomycetota bacterium]
MDEQQDTGRPLLRGDEFRHGGIFTLWGRSFKGPFGWTAIVVVVDALIALAVIVLGVLWLIQAQTVRGMIGALAVIMAAVAVLILAKIYGWLLIFHQAFLERIDALERRLADKDVTG